MKIGTPLRWVTAGLLTLAATLGTGCNTTHHQVNTVEPANPAYVRRNIEDKRIIRDSSTAKSVHVLNVIDGSTSDGLMRVGSKCRTPEASRSGSTTALTGSTPRGSP
jgi:hypothetical protein